jgi:N-acetylglutamate synthase-like GNAT family acetyltransferase
MAPSVEHSGRFGSGERPETHAAFVADTEGRVLGFVYMQIADAGHCAANVNALFATGDERGHGAGQALLNAALEWCRAHVAHEVSLDCIWPNDLARRFYENRGFRILLITYVRQLEPSDQTRIRVASTADVLAIARIVEYAYRDYIQRMGKPPGLMLDDYSARAPAGVVWVIEDTTTIVGILVLLPKPDHLLLDNIAVSPSHPRSGVRTAAPRIRRSRGIAAGLSRSPPLHPRDNDREPATLRGNRLYGNRAW